MASFAERMGLRPARSIVQKDDLDLETRTELWNITLALLTAIEESQRWDEPPTTHTELLAAVWKWEFKRAADEQGTDSQVMGVIKNTILKAEWVDALDLIEAMVGYAKRFGHWKNEDVLPAVVEAYNTTFEAYLVGYRFIDLKLVPIDSDIELGAVNAALTDAKSFKGARHHLDQAANHLADRKNPDYPNSIKESISAVEAVCVAVTGEHTLGAALKKLQAAGVKIHPALEGAWTKMYGWTSDADGIRHGSIDAPDADQALAKYMLVACSAFVSHIIEVGRKAKLI